MRLLGSGNRGRIYLGLVAVAALAVLTGCPSPSAPTGGDANRGRELFVSKQCITCHTVSSIISATGTIGPSLNGIGTAAADRKPGTSAEAYLRESIKEPNAFVPQGQQSPSLMLLPVPVSDAEITGLVAFLLTQR